MVPIFIGHGAPFHASEYSEERIQTIGVAHSNVLFVVSTLRGEDTCRIISARKATRHEQDRYYAGDRETW